MTSAATRILQRRSRVYVLMLALANGGTAACLAASPNGLVLQGSTTFNTNVAEPYGRAIETETGLKLEFIPNKSSLGILALFEKTADLAMISTDLQNEVEVLRPGNPKLAFDRLKSFEITRTRAAFVVHSSNPVRQLPLDAVRKILSGEIANWKDVGGADLPIRVVAVREGGGVLATVEQRLLGKAHISAPNSIRVQVGTQIVTVVGQEQGAFGITQLSIVQASHAVELKTDIPIAQVLSLVSLDKPSPEATSVIEAMRRKFQE